MISETVSCIEISLWEVILHHLRKVAALPIQPVSLAEIAARQSAIGHLGTAACIHICMAICPWL